MWRYLATSRSQQTDDTISNSTVVNIGQEDLEENDNCQARRVTPAHHRRGIKAERS